MSEQDDKIAELTEKIRENPNDAEAYCERGEGYYNKKDYDSAAADYEEALRIRPDYDYARKKLEIAYYYRGDYERKRTGIFVGYGNRGLEYDRILTYYDLPSIVGYEAAAEWYFEGASVEYGNGNYDQAIVYFDEAIRLDHNHVYAYCGRGHSYAEKSDYDKAVADYDAALQIRPDYGDAKDGLERVKSKMENN